jgi:hypothetical protein
MPGETDGGWAAAAELSRAIPKAKTVRVEPFDAACGVALDKLRRDTPSSVAEKKGLDCARLNPSTTLGMNGLLDVPAITPPLSGG